MGKNPHKPEKNGIPFAVKRRLHGRRSQSRRGQEQLPPPHTEFSYKNFTLTLDETVYILYTIHANGSETLRMRDLCLCFTYL